MASDESLYAEIRRGSKQAFAALYERYEGPLFGFILRRLPNREDAEDVFHEAMMAILKTPTMQFDRGGFAPWIYKVSLNLILNRARSRTRESNAKANYEHLKVVSVGEESTIEQDLGALAAAARSLSPTLAEMYKLRSNGKSYDEIADELSIPVGTVKSRIHLMVAHLRKGFKR